MILLQMLRFNNNNNDDDPLIKIRPIVNSFKICFSQSFYPYKDVCIKENFFVLTRPILL